MTMTFAVFCSVYFTLAWLGLIASAIRDVRSGRF